MTQMQITLPEVSMDALRKAAKQKGVTPNILARIVLAEQFGDTGLIDSIWPDGRPYTVNVKNWREAEAYVEVKGLRSVEDLAVRTLFAEMKKHSLKPAQKVEFDRLLGK